MDNQKMNTLPEGVTKFKLAMCCPCGDDGTSLVRGEGPFFAMAKEDRRLEIELAPVNADGEQAITWNWIGRNDALFLQRPFRPIDLHAAVLAKYMGRPVWLDWDDDLSSVPHSNSYRKLYDPEKMRQTIGKLATLADVVTVTTVALKRKIEEVAGLAAPVANGGGQGTARPTAEKVIVVPNACHWPFSEAKRQRRITWRGGHSHDGDVLEFLPVIAELARLPQYSLWKWCFLGEPPWQVREAIPAAQFETWADHQFNYMPAFGYLGPWVNIVPLKDTTFNHSKSNLAWIEGACAGAMTIAPNWEEWRRPGVAPYRDAEEFVSQLKSALGAFTPGTPGILSAHAVASREFIRENLMLEQVNQMRWDILRRFAGNLPVGTAASPQERTVATV